MSLNPLSVLSVFLMGAASVAFVGCDGSPPVGDAVHGAVLFDTGDGINPNPGCDTCHCSDGSGGCQLNAPNNQGASYDLIDSKTRDPNAYHPGGKYDFSDQDVADIQAFLAQQAAM